MIKHMGLVVNILVVMGLVIAGIFSGNMVTFLMLGAMYLLGSLANMVFTRLKAKSALNEISDSLHLIAKGDFKQSLDTNKYGSQYEETFKGIDEVQAFNRKMFEQLIITSVNTTSLVAELQTFLQENVTKVSEVAQSVSLMADHSNSYADSMSRSGKELAQVEDVMSTIGGIVTDADKASRQSMEASSGAKVLVDDTVGNFEHVMSGVAHLETYIQDLSKDANQIADFAKRIEEIADHTNLLALNASIESARAGEAGRGFAVVAEEIRKLSIGTTETLGEIHSIVDTIMKGVGKAVENSKASSEMGAKAVDQALAMKSSFDGIERNAITTEEKVSEAYKTLTRLQESVHTIVDNISGLSHLTDDTNEQAQSSSQNMFEIESQMNTLSGQVDSLHRQSDEFNEFVAVNSTDCVLRNRLEALLAADDQLKTASDAKVLAKKLNVDQFQVLDNSGKVVMATEEGSIGLNLFELYPPYREHFEKRDFKPMFTPIVPRLDGYYARFVGCVSKTSGRYIIVEYTFNIKQ